MDAFVARQPIFDRKKALFAYELLFRNGLSNFVPDIDGDMATSSLLSSSFFTIGIEQITGGRKAFINFTENLIIQELPLLFPHEKTVVEVLEDVRPLETVLLALKKLSAKGYYLALDDFIFQKNLEPLIQLANLIKIDFRQTPISEIQKLLDSDHLKGKKLLAEKVETNSEFNQASEMGFHYFQGYFFCRPEIIKSKEIADSNISLLRILSEVNKPDSSFGEIEKMVTTDLSVSYKLLRYINSAFFNRKNEITSIKQALIYLGENELRRFISLITLSKIGASKPTELIRNACIRARFCELINSVSHCAESPDMLFTLGLFSNIDAILDKPMTEIMNHLPLSEKIISALVDNTGPLSAYLELIKTYEKGDWNPIPKLANQICIAEEVIPSLYREACNWSNALTG
ncbi:MAG: HDOD domain-containing protein [Desulfobacteraceae bacterium]|nr:MAG: HDOD domain-containing protein [Desulfobacteraceae bacterium]